LTCPRHCDTALRETLSVLLIATAVLCAASGRALADALTLEEYFEDWAVFVRDRADGKSCYAVTWPWVWKPAEAGDAPSHLYVSTFLKRGIHNEVSVTLGTPLEETAPAVGVIRKNEFAFLARGRRLFPRDGAEQKRLLTAMRRWRWMTVKAHSRAGNELEYRFSLRGLIDALAHVKKVCK
jgi:hypothetical protein